MSRFVYFIIVQIYLEYLRLSALPQKKLRISEAWTSFLTIRSGLKNIDYNLRWMNHLHVFVISENNREIIIYREFQYVAYIKKWMAISRETALCILRDVDFTWQYSTILCIASSHLIYWIQRSSLFLIYLVIQLFHSLGIKYLRLSYIFKV